MKISPALAGLLCLLLLLVLNCSMQGTAGVAAGDAKPADATESILGDVSGDAIPADTPDLLADRPDNGDAAPEIVAPSDVRWHFEEQSEQSAESDIPLDVSSMADEATADLCVPVCEGKECGDDDCGGTCGVCAPGQACINNNCPAEGMTCDDGNDINWDGCTDGQITEFQVNSLPAAINFNTGPDVAVLSGGASVVVWTHCGEDELNCQIVGTRLTLGADSAEEEFTIASDENTSHWQPAIASAENDQYVVVWRATTGNPQNGKSVIARCFAPDGSAAGPEIQLSGVGPAVCARPRVLALGESRFVVAWSSCPFVDESAQQGQDGWGCGVVGRLLTCPDNIETQEFLLSDAFLGNQWAVALAPANEDGFVAAWHTGYYWGHWPREGVAEGKFGRTFAGDGTPLTGDFEIASLAESKEAQWNALAPTPGGGFLAVYPTGGVFSQVYEIRGQAFGGGGGKLGNSFEVSSSEVVVAHSFPAIAGFEQGGYVAVWNMDHLDGKVSSVMAQKLDASGDKVGPLLQANVCDDVFDINYPSVDVFSDGSYMIVWTYGTGGNKSVFAQRFDAEGNKLYH